MYHSKSLPNPWKPYQLLFAYGAEKAALYRNTSTPVATKNLDFYMLVV